MINSSVTSGYQWKKLGDLEASVFPGCEVESADTEPSEHQLGYAEGHSEGYQVGLAQAAQEQAKVLALLQQLVEETQRLRERSINECLQDMSVALHRIFKLVFGHELRTSPELIQALAEEIGVTLQAETTPQLGLNQHDYAAIAPQVSEELRRTLKVDDGLPAGVVRASAGKSMLELDVVANLERVLAEGVISGALEGDTPISEESVAPDHNDADHQSEHE